MSGTNYGVTYDPVGKKFSGNAWGDSVAGWVNFDHMTVDIITPPSSDVCTDPNATNATATPLGPNQISNPAVCTYSIDICTQYPTLCNQTFCQLHPRLCLTPNDICGLIPGEQTASEFTFPGLKYGRSWYGLSGGYCALDACKDTTDVATYGFQAYIPVYINGNWYDKDPSDGVCKKKDTIIPGGGTGGSGGTTPIKPIYIEN
jgi:hypothetical protein